MRGLDSWEHFFSQKKLLWIAEYDARLCGLGQATILNLKQRERFHQQSCLTRPYQDIFAHRYHISVEDICRQVKKRGYSVQLYSQNDGQRDDNWYYRIVRKNQ